MVQNKRLVLIFKLIEGGEGGSNIAVYSHETVHISKTQHERVSFKEV